MLEIDFQLAQSFSTIRSLMAEKRPLDPGEFADGLLSQFEERHLVSVQEPWRVLLDFIVTKGSRIVLIRAPPRSGKSFLGELGVKAVPAGIEVRYCANVGSEEQLDGLLKRGGYQDLSEMAKMSASSGDDTSKPTIVYYFDEAHEIPQAIINAFVKSGSTCGYAVFATAGRATLPDSYITPMELLDRTFYYRSPASFDEMQKWLRVKFVRLFQRCKADMETEAATEILMNFSNGIIGVITFFGRTMEEYGCKCLADVRNKIRQVLEDPKDLYIRIFGTQNGTPNATQALLISMLRCSGSLGTVTLTGEQRSVWDNGNLEHRRGLSLAYYGPKAPSAPGPIVQMTADSDISFVHPLQPEIYLHKFKDAWAKLRHEERWVANFNGDENGEPSVKPMHVIDVILSWLSHVKTPELLYVYKEANVDIAETEFQRSFDLFCKDVLGMKAKREVYSTGNFLDHFVEEGMGIEFVIRSSSDNKLSSTGLLTNEATKKSLVEHVGRPEAKYNEIAQKCSKGYITVLPATLIGATVDEEWQRFQQLAGKELAQSAHPVLVALAPFGWATWHVFLQRSGKEPVHVQIPRQRLMIKLVKGVPMSARQFYPKPEEVWVQRLTSDMKLIGRAFEVKPNKDNVAALAEMIKDAESLTCPLSQLAIYRQNWKGEWQEEAEEKVLYENTKQRPYGFLNPG